MNTQQNVQRLYEQADVIGVAATMAEHFQMPVRLSLGFSARACSQSIDEMDLSVRSLNCLKRANIMTVGQLVDIAGTEELLKIRNLGRKSLSEIKTTLLVIGYEQLTESEKTEFWQCAAALNPGVHFT